MSEKKETQETQELVKVKVLKRCHDINDETKKYAVGEEIEIDSERAEAGEAAGLLEIVTQAI
jgi:hypothetical protein